MSIHSWPTTYLNWGGASVKLISVISEVDSQFDLVTALEV